MLNIDRIPFKDSNNFLVLNELDPFTGSNWRSLILKANERGLPCYLLGVHTTTSQGNHYYDGIGLKKFHNVNSVAEDPISGSTIERVQFFYLNTFKLSSEGTEEAYKEEEYFFVRLEPFPEYQQEALAALNLHSPDLKTVAKCQCVYALYLLTKVENPEIQKEGVRWLICAAKNHELSAAKLLVKLYQQGNIVNKSPLKVKHWSQLIKKHTEIA